MRIKEPAHATVVVLVIVTCTKMKVVMKRKQRFVFMYTTYCHPLRGSLRICDIKCQILHSSAVHFRLKLL